MLGVGISINVSCHRFMLTVFVRGLRKRMKQPTANDIVDLLLRKHSKDLCIPECKTGGTYVGHYGIMDLWVIKKSFATPTAYAYEVKINRQDFLRDTKWKKYLDYCNEFYFVAPPGIIEPNELAPETGLLITSKNAKLLYTKKKAANRDITIPTKLFLYVLFWRSTTHHEKETAGMTKIWENWLNDKKAKLELGRAVSKKINDLVFRLEKENAKLQKIEYQYGNIKQALLDAGYEEKDIYSWAFPRRFRDDLVGKKQIPSAIINNAKIIKTAIRRLQNEIETFEHENRKEQEKDGRLEKNTDIG